MLNKTLSFSADPPSSKAVDSDTESMMSSVSSYTLGGKKKKRYGVWDNQSFANNLLYLENLTVMDMTYELKSGILSGPD